MRWSIAKVDGSVVRACTKVFGDRLMTDFVVEKRMTYIGVDGNPLPITYYSPCRVWNFAGERQPKVGDTISCRGRLVYDRELDKHRTNVMSYTIA